MHALAPYTVKVNDRSLTGPLEQRNHPLDNIRGTNFLDLFYQFAMSHSTKYLSIHEDKKLKTIKFSDVSKTKTCIHGWIDYGDFGVKGRVVDINTAETKYKKRTHDSDVKQHYFNFTFSPGSKVGLLVLHQIQGNGVKTLLSDLLSDELEKKTKGLKPRIAPLADAKLVRDWMNEASVRRITLTKYLPTKLPKDIADSLGEDNTVELSIKSKKGATLGSLYEFTKFKKHTGSQRDLVDIFEAHSESVKAEVEYLGRKRTFSLAAESIPISTVEFDSKDVEIDEGVPKLQSLHKFASNFCADLLKRLG